MIRADENMPELTDDELCEWRERLQYEEYEADAEAVADDAQAERLHPHADPQCKYCHGTGTVYDSVDYGSTTVQMPSTCDCVEDDIDPDEMTTAEAYAILREAGYDPVKVGRRGAAIAALTMLAQFGDDDEVGDDLGVCCDAE